MHSSLPHRCYNKIWNDWFRDENLQDSVVVDVDNGPDTPTDYVLLKRGKRHDYFTACLPYPQKSNTAVSMPLGTSADIHTASDHAESVGVYSDAQSAYRNLDSSGANTSVDTTQFGNKLYADLSGATAATINAIRLA